MTVSSSNIGVDVWRLFYDRIKSQVRSVTLSNGDIARIKDYSDSFPDRKKETGADYPIILINHPEIGTEPLSFRSTMTLGSITIEVIGTGSQTVDRFSDAIINKIISYSSDLEENGIENVQVEDTTSPPSAKKGELNLHSRQIRFSFEYTFT